MEATDSMITLTDEQFTSLREFTFNNYHLPAKEFTRRLHSWWENILGWKPEHVESLGDRQFAVYSEQ